MFPERGTDSKVTFKNYVQLLFKICKDVQTMMFPERGTDPKVFKAVKNIRCIVDYTEFKIKCSGTLRGRVILSLLTSIVILSSGRLQWPHMVVHVLSRICLKVILITYRFLKSVVFWGINPGNVVVTDRGFTVRKLLNPRHVTLKMLSFLKGRTSLTAAEELETRRIAKARSHVECFNECLKRLN